MNKVAIIIPYFGKFPNYFRATILSMAHNPLFDWYIITDSIFNFNFENIRFITRSFSDIQKLAFEKLGTKLSSPYKLCDYRPSYGILFSDILGKYQYWGNSDLDLVYGDLTFVYRIIISGSYEKVLKLGHFSVYKNNEVVNNLFKRSGDKDKLVIDYKEIFNNKYNLAFDESYEGGGINKIINASNLSLYENNRIFCDLDFRYKNFRDFTNKHYKNFYLVYDNGHLLMKFKNSEKEIIYVHFQKRKKYNFYAEGDNFLITPKGIYDFKGDINLKEYSYFFNFRFLWNIHYRVKRYFNNVKCNHWCKKNNNKAIVKRKNY